MADVSAVQIATRWTPEGVVVSASGEIDPARAPILTATLEALLEAGQREVVLDLAAVSSADASCLGAIAAAAIRFQGVAGAFVVRAPGPMARRLLALTELDGLIEESNDVEPVRGSTAPPLLGALQTRAVISQAQGVIMSRYGVTAEAAFLALLRSAQVRGTRIDQRASEIVALTAREGLIGDIHI